MRSILFAAVALCPMVLAAVGWAQENLPAPPPGVAPPAAEPAPPPPQPGDRLRGLGNLFAPPGGGGPPLDYNRLNEAVRALASSLPLGDYSIESFSLVFDPKYSDLMQDRLGIVSDGALRRTAWSSAPTAFHADARATVDMSTPGAAKAPIELRFSLKTDVVKLADHAVRRYRERRCGSPPPTQSPPDPLREQVCEKLAGLPPLASFEDVADLFQSLSAVLFQDRNDRILELKKQLAAETDEAKRQKLSADLESERHIRDRMTKIKAQVVRDATGNAQSIQAKIQNIALNDTFFAPQAEITVTASEIVVNGVIEIRRGVEMYGLFKGIIQVSLARLAESDPATIAQIRTFILAALSQAQAVSQGAPPGPVPGTFPPGLAPQPAPPPPAPPPAPAPSP